MAELDAPVTDNLDDESGSFAHASQGTTRTRAISFAIALGIEALLILLLFLIGWNTGNEGDQAETVTTFEAKDFGPDEPAPQEEAPAEPADQPTEFVPPQPQPPQPPQPQPVTPPLTPPLPPPPVVVSPVPAPPPPVAAPAPPAPPAPPAKPPARVYGPPSPGGGSRSANDSERVGTTSTGEPLYAARWYREPTRQELAGYLSTATGPATALVACRTVPNFRVEDCELIGESPQGSQIGRAVLAATWQFRVRPARIGGESQVGSWVRIRIDYIERRPG